MIGARKQSRAPEWSPVLGAGLSNFGRPKFAAQSSLDANLVDKSRSLAGALVDKAKAYEVYAFSFVSAQQLREHPAHGDVD